MAAFLLESEPAKFLKLLKRLRGGEEQAAALEESYKATLEELEQRLARLSASVQNGPDPVGHRSNGRIGLVSQNGTSWHLPNWAVE